MTSKMQADHNERRARDANRRLPHTVALVDWPVVQPRAPAPNAVAPQGLVTAPSRDRCAIAAAGQLRTWAKR